MTIPWFLHQCSIPPRISRMLHLDRLLHKRRSPLSCDSSQVIRFAQNLCQVWILSTVFVELGGKPLVDIHFLLRIDLLSTGTHDWGFFSGVHLGRIPLFMYSFLIFPQRLRVLVAEQIHLLYGRTILCWLEDPPLVPKSLWLDILIGLRIHLSGQKHRGWGLITIIWYWLICVQLTDLNHGFLIVLTEYHRFSNFNCSLVARPSCFKSFPSLFRHLWPSYSRQIYALVLFR